MAIDFGNWSQEGWSTSPGSEEPGKVLDWLNFSPDPGAAIAEEVDFEPTVISVPLARRDFLLRQAGWRPASIQLLIRGFDGQPLRSHACYLTYEGPRGEMSTGISELTGGTATYPDFWIKPQGVLRLMAVPLVGTPAAGGPLLEGSLAVPERIASAYIPLTATQEYRDVQIRASTQQQVAEQMQVQGSVKFSILGTAEIGVGAGSTTTTTQGGSREMTWNVRIGTASLTILPAPR